MPEVLEKNRTTPRKLAALAKMHPLMGSAREPQKNPIKTREHPLRTKRATIPREHAEKPREQPMNAQTAFREQP